MERQGAVMNKYIEAYNSKKVSIEEALSVIRPDDEVITSIGPLEPMEIMSRLHTIRDKVNKIKIWNGLNMGVYDFCSKSEMRDNYELRSWFYSAPTRKAQGVGIASYEPGNLHNIFIRKLQEKSPNIFIGTVAPMDKHGYFRFSLSVVYEKECFEAADIVILEVNPNLPQVHGDTEIHISDVDYIVEIDRPLPELPKTKISEVNKKIGENVASLVNDGDTIQLGIGQIPDAVAMSFMSKKDLGIHTEMISNSIVDLVEAGVITGKKKNINKGKIVGTFALGSKRLYDFMDNNPSIRLMRGSYVNDPYVIAQNDNMVSINTALEVDLTGQVCSESIGSLHFSGTGGQNDFSEGAIHSKNGRSIIALHSTAKKGTISTIRPCLSQGAVVTLSRNNIDYIVTEYGIANLKAKTVKERVDSLISIAHPNFREELEKEAIGLSLK